MAKILLVEDDNNLREIYEARLQAEGYEIVAARDGEEALTVAMKERPDLIISDVMMPKISGFDMLDIIRSTEEIKDVKVIMMTALSQAEDKARADKLGADRYLVKSQVTLEDVAKVAREVLNETDAPQAQVASAPVAADAATQEQQTTQMAAPVTVAIAPDPVPSSQAAMQSQAMAAVSPTVPLADDVQELSQTSDQEQAEINAQIDSFIDSSRPVVAQSPADSTPQAVQPTENTSNADEQPTDVPSVDPQAQSGGKKIIQPLNDPTVSGALDLHRLLEKEEQNEQMSAIAHDVASKNTERVEEFAAEETLRKAEAHRVEVTVVEDSAEESAQPQVENDAHTPEVAISDDGNLRIATAPEDQGVETPSDPTPMNFEETPVLAIPPSETSEETTSQLEPVHPEPLQALTQPNIPHTNGVSIDGVSARSTPSSASPVQSPMEPPIAPQTEQANIADDIAL
jgi:two-component system alkaline phosphatase synthesis response regulator PhoP